MHYHEQETIQYNFVILRHEFLFYHISIVRWFIVSGDSAGDGLLRHLLRFNSSTNILHLLLWQLDLRGNESHQEHCLGCPAQWIQQRSEYESRYEFHVLYARFGGIYELFSDLLFFCFVNFLVFCFRVVASCFCLTF